MLKRIIKSKWFWLVFLFIVALRVAYHYGYGFDTAVYYVGRIINPPENLTFDEALQLQSAKESDHTTDLVTANVIGTDPKNNTLTVSFVWPPGFVTKIFGDKEPTSTVKVGCTKEESSITVTRVLKDQQTPEPQDTKVLETGVDIVSEAKSEDSIIAFCADEECSELIRICELNRTFVVEK